MLIPTIAQKTKKTTIPPQQPSSGPIANLTKQESLPSSLWPMTHSSRAATTTEFAYFPLRPWVAERSWQSWIWAEAFGD